MTQRTKVKLLGQDITVFLDDSREGDTCGCVRVKEGRVEMVFYGLLDQRTLVHECWHAVFLVLSTVDKAEHTFSELMNEVYAYVFSDFCSEILEKVTAMRLYKRMYDDKEREDKETAKLP